MRRSELFVDNGRGIHVLFPLFRLLGLLASNKLSNNQQIRYGLFDDYL